ncbi:MAG: ParB/RepB/Spo0J family partition protein [Spirochaetales bacterium]|nr:MAG: ParB/RepB/Spo0J family partition protein [Spirochaetales bacterium]
MGRRRLGKGIDALLQGRDLEQLTTMASIIMVDIDHVEANPHQPRTTFNDETLKELADSIRAKGVLQPILAEDRGDGTYLIIAGERRYRAARLAGLTQIPVISQDFSDEEKIEIALIENIQREDLNPIDEARAIKGAMELSETTQEEMAKRLGKSRSAIANALRLLKLDPEMQKDLADGTLTAGHARALLAVDDPAERATLWKRITTDGITVREAERSGTAKPNRQTPRKSSPDEGATQAHKSVELTRLEDKLVRHLGTRVIICGTDQRGKIEIAYLSTDDLERLVEAMGDSFDE